MTTLTRMKRAVSLLRGFTLLEVMVAIAILGLSVTAILSAQAGAVHTAGHARHMSVAVGLARCKMNELEEQIAIEGFPAIDDVGSGACCEGDETSNITCTWRIERPTFPEPDLGELNLDTKLEGTALGQLASGAENGEAAASGDIGDVASQLAGGDVSGLAGVAAGGINGVASMVMSMVYPQLKLLMEASTRRLTVELSWREGSKEYGFEVVQWVTQPQQGLLPDTDELEDALTGGAPGLTPPGAAGAGNGTGPGDGRGGR